MNANERECHTPLLERVSELRCQVLDDSEKGGTTKWTQDEHKMVRCFGLKPVEQCLFILCPFCVHFVVLHSRNPGIARQRSSDSPEMAMSPFAFIRVHSRFLLPESIYG